MATSTFKPPAKPRFVSGGLRELTPEALEHESVYRACVLDRQVLAGQHLRSVSFEGCVFRHTDLSHVDWQRVRLADVRFEGCTLNGAKWTEVSLERAEFSDCRMLGLQLPEGRLRDVRLSRVQASLSLWFRADTRKFWAEESDFAEAVFMEAMLPGAVFRGCRLPRTDFAGAALGGADLRTSDLASARLGLRELADVTVEAAQLVDLAHLLGVLVQDL